MGTFFISDPHFNHKNIIEYSKRPFADVAEMNAVLINNWNATVGPDDDIYIVGDVCMGQRSDMPAILARLQGRKHLIKGNHDIGMLKDAGNRAVFTSIQDILEIRVALEMTGKASQLIVMCHFGIESWNEQAKGAWHLHGHSHGTLPTPNTMLRLDVGVDETANRLGRVASSYRPLTLAEIRHHMSHKKFAPVDHHGAS